MSVRRLRRGSLAPGGHGVIIQDRIRGPQTVYGTITYSNERGTFYVQEFADQASYEDALNKAAEWASGQPRRPLDFVGERRSLHGPV